ncbi:site-2 protease family protein, partial [Actinosynnema sp. NPDC059797]
RFDEFAAAVPAALRGWGLVGLLVVTVLSSVFHEGGHALACRAYGVPVREVGLGLRSLAVFAWTEPDRRRWDALPPRRKLVTVAAGPLGSLCYAGLGALLWATAPGPAAVVGVWLVLAGTVCVVPTLLPSFDGDAYLLLTCLPGLGNLRSRSFAALRGLPRGGKPGAAVLGHVAFALLTVLGRIAVAGVVLWVVHLGLAG